MFCTINFGALMWRCQGLSAGLIFIGVWIVTAYTKFEHLSDLLVSSLLPAYILLAVGIVLFSLGTIGCIGAVREYKCLIGLVKFHSCPRNLQDMNNKLVSVKHQCDFCLLVSSNYRIIVVLYCNLLPTFAILYLMCWVYFAFRIVAGHQKWLWPIRELCCSYDTIW